MAVKYEYRRWFLRLIFPVIVLTLVVFLSDAPLRFTILALVAGLLLRFFSGQWAWREIKKQISQRNTLVLFAIENGWYGLVLLFGLLSFIPGGSGRLSRFIVNYPDIFLTFAICFLTVGITHNAVIAAMLRKHERRKGPLKVTRFYSPSVSGLEGMLGAKAEVVQTCNPHGRVKAKSETWNATSLEGTLEAGEKVVVREVEGLRLFVEKPQRRPIWPSHGSREGR